MRFPGRPWTTSCAVWLLVLGGCARGGHGTASSSRPLPPPPPHRAVIDEHLSAAKGHGLPNCSAEEAAEVGELLDATQVGGHLGAMARRDLASREDPELCAALLTLLETHGTPTSRREQAYALLRKRALPAAVPRLILRLKYEKDWSANATLAATLLRFGNGAGLIALHNVLATESAPAAARSAAAAVLPELPGASTDMGFPALWQQLLSVEGTWNRNHLLPGWKAEQGGPELEAEVWRMIARLRSQPLRPVDDARYVLSRMRCGVVVPALLEAGFDTDPYAREHAFQTLGWIGYPVGRWARRSGFPYLERLRPALGDPVIRLRVLEALAAAGNDEAALLALPWLERGNRDETTEAANTLLRCASSALFPVARRVLAAATLSPEARWSLLLLLHDGESGPSPTPPPGLADGERIRRLAWARARARRPGGKEDQVKNSTQAGSQ